MISNHIIRLGTHAEKEYLQRALAWYGEVMLNANLVEATPTASAAFLVGLSKDQRYPKPYTIDPITYVFSLAPDLLLSRSTSGGVRQKRTFSALQESYGVLRITGGASDRLTPNVFTPAAVDAFSNAVVEYQVNRIDTALTEVAAFMGLEGDAVLAPVRILAPYFHINERQEWLQVNLIFLETVSALRPKDTWGVVCLDGFMLDNWESVEDIATRYRAIACNGYMLWMTDFDEVSVTETQIRSFKRLVEVLAGPENDRPVINMYGGYLSTLLFEEGLTGIAHGLGYGDRRSLVPPVGGGLPPAKFYLRSIHNEISMPELARVAGTMSSQQEYLDRICSCPICRRLVQGGIQALLEAFGRTERRAFRDAFRDFATPDVYRLARYHFLYNRFQEIRGVNDSQDGDALRRELSDAYAMFQPILPTTNLGYLNRWRRALT